MLTTKEVADYLRAHDDYLILTHKRPDGDTLGCAAALCRMLRGVGKTAWLLKNDEVTDNYAPYVDGLWAAEDYAYATVVSVDLAALSLFPQNAEGFRERVDLAIDHHPSYEDFGKLCCVHPECAACGEILYEVAVELGQLTPEVALPLYVAVATAPPAARSSTRSRSSWDSSRRRSRCRCTSRWRQIQAALCTPTSLPTPTASRRRCSTRASISAW